MNHRTTPELEKLYEECVAEVDTAKAQNPAVASHVELIVTPEMWEAVRRRVERKRSVSRKVTP